MESPRLRVVGWSVKSCFLLVPIFLVLWLDRFNACAISQFSHLALLGWCIQPLHRQWYQPVGKLSLDFLGELALCSFHGMPLTHPSSRKWHWFQNSNFSVNKHILLCSSFKVTCCCCQLNRLAYVKSLILKRTTSQIPLSISASFTEFVN